jgi:autotransporter-associated beta strand protein/T5SS/PEP-CTERM-associated repeat protein
VKPVTTLLLLACQFVVLSAAHAATTTYTSAWSGGTIAPGDTAVIENGGSITGDVTADGTLQFNQTTSLTVTSTISGTGALSLTNTGTVSLQGLTSGTARFDLAIDVLNGRFVSGSSNSNGFVVGDLGTGSMTVSGGVATTYASILGHRTTGVGTALVSSGSWTTRVLQIGAAGSGSLTVQGGGVASTTAAIGSAGGSGTVQVTGGTWTAGGPLYVGGYTSGSNGNGTLTLTNGQVTCTFGNIGFSAGSVGLATINGGTWSSSQVLFVGRSGDGTLNMTGGRVTSASGTIGASAGSTGAVTISGGTWSNAGALTVGGAGTGTLTISGSGGSGGTVIVGGTLSRGASGTINLSPGGTLQIGTGTTASGGLATDLVNNGSMVFNRTGAATVANTISGTGSLSLAGSGTITFSGSNSFTGPTAVNAGALSVTGAFGNSAVSVNAGGRLLGSGTLGGPVAVAAGGILAPGVGIESLAVGATSLFDGSAFVSELNSTAPLSAAADLLTIAGNLSLSGTVNLVLLDLAVTPAAFPAGTTLSLASYTGGWNGGPFRFDGSVLADGATFSTATQLWAIDYDATSGGVNFTGDHLAGGSFVNLVAVPEPSALATLGIGLAGGAVWLRRRRTFGIRSESRRVHFRLSLPEAPAWPSPRSPLVSLPRSFLRMSSKKPGCS